LRKPILGSLIIINQLTSRTVILPSYSAMSVSFSPILNQFKQILII